jgi:hypothetical protein
MCFGIARDLPRSRCLVVNEIARRERETTGGGLGQVASFPFLLSSPPSIDCSCVAGPQRSRQRPFRIGADIPAEGPALEQLGRQ